MAPLQISGKIVHSYCYGRHRIALWRCSCMIVSTLLVPASSLLTAPSIAPLLRQTQGGSERQFFSAREWEGKHSKEYDERSCSGVSVLDSCSKQLPQHRLAPRSFTQLRMSTSMPSGGFNVSEPSTWENEDGYENENESDDGDETAEEDDSTALLEEYTTWNKAVDNAVKTLGRKRDSLQSELTKAEGVESTTARAQLLVSNLYMFQGGAKTAIVNDWENEGKEVELTLDSKYDSASAEADALFSLIRKLKRGSKIVAELLEETDAAWEILSEAKLDLKSARGGDLESGIDEGRLAIVKERLIRTSRTTKFQVPSANDADKNNSKRGGQNGKNRRERKPELGSPASNVRKLMSPGGCIVLVGRNRRGNEYLSMTIARGNDIWMHSRGCPGAHVIIQNRRGSPTVTDECLQFGADLAIFYSDLRNENKAEVTAAEPKHIQKPRGAPLGAVKLREEWKTFVGRPDQVPEELKEAREKSGQSDEYHMFDKAKHRRRTKQVAEEDRAKRRQQQREKKNQN